MVKDALDPALRSQLVALAERACGGRVAQIDGIPAGLGHRIFVRITLMGSKVDRAVARIDPPGAGAADALGAEPPLEPIRSLLESNGLPVPRRYGGDEAAGIELLEDVGDESLERAANTRDGSARHQLYARALALVPALQRVDRPGRGPAVAAFDRRFDQPLIETKAKKWLEWSLPELLGRAATTAEIAGTDRAFSFVGRTCEAAPTRLAHRDFKAANIHLCPDTGESAPERLVLIDLQGAFMAPPEYDAVCLLRDAHVPLPAADVDAHLSKLREALPDRPAAVDLERRFDLITLVRVAKDISHYLHAWRERDDGRYLRFVPAGLVHLRTAAARAASRDEAVDDFARLVADLPEYTPDREASRCAP